MIVTILLLQKSNVVLSANCEIPEVGESLELFLIGNMIIYFTRRIRRTHYSFM